MLNANNERELAYVVLIDGIEPIPGYDRVETAIVGGWHVIVQKDQFKVGDPAIYFEIDSRVPKDKECFAFLEKRNYKIKTLKMCKTISQGLLMHASDFGWNIIFDGTNTPYIYDGEKVHYADDESRFLTKILGVTYADDEDNQRKAPSVDKYKKMIQRHPNIFKKPWARWIMPWILNDTGRWIVTEKIDGSSTTFTMKRGKRGKNEFYVCSRNVCFDSVDKPCYYDTNIYWEMAQKYDMYNILSKLLEITPEAEWVTVQGETYGAGVQKRDYSMDGHDFKAFNLIFSHSGRYGTLEMQTLLEGLGVPCVPVVNDDFYFDEIEGENKVDSLLEMATGESAVDGKPREGFVLRSVDGTKSFKAVSNSFLLKYHS